MALTAAKNVLDPAGIMNSGKLLTPLMTTQRVTDRVRKALLRGEAQALMPWTVHLSKVLNGILPLAAWDYLAGNVFGVYTTMTKFTGRR